MCNLVGLNCVAEKWWKKKQKVEKSEFMKKCCFNPSQLHMLLVEWTWSENLKVWKKKYFGKIWHRDLFGKGTVPVLVEYLSEILWKRKCEKTTMFGTSRCLKNVYVWMCPICIFVSVETFLSLNMCLGIMWHKVRQK